MNPYVGIIHSYEKKNTHNKNNISIYKKDVFDRFLQSKLIENLLFITYPYVYNI